MTAEEIWNLFTRTRSIDIEPDVWAFGDSPDELAELVLSGTKTATCSACPLYELSDEPLPEADCYSVILNGKGEAVCVIRTERVYILPFREVGADFAKKEGEGDQSLKYWQKVHENFFRRELEKSGLVFDEEMAVVCEEFEVVYRPGD